jgi:signal transduction histidine kinase
MRKTIAILFLLIVIRSTCAAQDDWKKRIDSQWTIVSHDTSRALLLAETANYYKFKKPDSGFFYAYKALALARQINFPKAQVHAMQVIGITQIVLGNDAKALQINLQAAKIADENNLPAFKAVILVQRGIIHSRSRNYAKALGLFRQSLILTDSVGYADYYTATQSLIADIYLMTNQLDSAQYYGQLAYENAARIKVNWVTHAVLLNLAKIHSKSGNTDLAMAYLYQSLPEAFEKDKIILSYFSIAQLYQQTGKPDSSIYYAKQSLEMAQEGSFYAYAIDASVLLSGIYEKADVQKALEYNRMAITYKDSLYNQGREIALENLLTFDEQERQYEIETAQKAYRNQVKQYVLIAGLLVFLLIAFLLYRNNRHGQKAYSRLQKQKQETEIQKVKAEQTLNELRATQAQLVQREKMASLGELTAGIAHEIQNPLNFVNNFSEVNVELIDDLRQDLKAGKIDDALTVSNDIKENEQKINHHGKRADAIVKGMLQHSRSNSAVKEPTDINKLADEYLRLAYHGLRAKDQSFNATIKTDFDKSIGNINIIAQDIGRVILNLVMNAFSAVADKKKQIGDDYEPIVSVSTQLILPPPGGSRGAEIKVADNGNGIPEKILDKIFQPFFTTKPTGEGTGLGLSLTYDIVKAHGGEIKVETKESEGTEFIIQLPL